MFQHTTHFMIWHTNTEALSLSHFPDTLFILPLLSSSSSGVCCMYKEMLCIPDYDYTTLGLKSTWQSDHLNLSASLSGSSPYCWDCHAVAMLLW